MRYLFCDKCERYHELQPDESPDNFSDQCECGGKLEYVDYYDEFPNIKNNNKQTKDEKGTPILMILISALCVYNGNYINQLLITSIGIIGIIFGLFLLIIRIKGLGRILNVRYMKLIYFFSAILFLALSISLINVLLQVHINVTSGIPVHTNIKSIGIIGILIFVSLMFTVNMLLKTLNPYKRTKFDPKF